MKLLEQIIVANSHGLNSGFLLGRLRRGIYWPLCAPLIRWILEVSALCTAKI